MMWVTFLVVLVASSVEAMSVKGIVKDSVTGIPLAYSRVNVTAGNEIYYRDCAVDGSFTFNFNSAAGTSATFLTQNAGYQASTRVIPLPSSNTIPPSTFDQSMTVSPTAVASGLRVVLTWGASPLDLDLRATAYCGIVTWARRTLAVGGTPMRLDADVTTGYGPETIKVLSNLPCGDYDFYVSIYSRNSYFRAGTATVTVYSDSSPTPLRTYVSTNPPNNYNVWLAFTYQVRLVNPATYQRSYTIVDRGVYSSILPSSGSFIQGCQADFLFCSDASRVVVSSMVMMTLLLLIVSILY